jgi:Flp pilus assembly protein TadG
MSASRPVGIFTRLRREELGVTSVFVILLMTVLLISAALVVDIGAMQARKAQLQDAADAAVLAIAQECHDSSGSSSLGCAPSVVSSAAVTASELAVANLNDGAATVESVEFPSPDTVRVVLSSTQTGYFGVFAGVDSTDLRADATARWEQEVVPLPLALASCNFPAAGQQTVLQVSLAVSSLVPSLLGNSCGLLSSENVLSSLNGTVGIVSGGWITSSDPILGATAGACEYDPNLLTTVASTISKVAPTSCANALHSWAPSASNPQRVVLPVFDSGLEQLVVDDVLGIGTIDRYAVVDITGYSMSGLLGLSTVAGSNPALCTDPRGLIARDLDRLLDSLGLLDPLRPVLQLLLTATTPVTGCQALAGTFIGYVDSIEAAQLLVGVQLVE